MFPFCVLLFLAVSLGGIKARIFSSITFFHEASPRVCPPLASRLLKFKLFVGFGSRQHQISLFSLLCQIIIEASANQYIVNIALVTLLFLKLLLFIV
jgi:hypothetical protein